MPHSSDDIHGWGCGGEIGLADDRLLHIGIISKANGKTNGTRGPDSFAILRCRMADRGQGAGQTGHFSLTVGQFGEYGSDCRYPAPRLIRPSTKTHFCAVLRARRDGSLLEGHTIRCPSCASHLVHQSRRKGLLEKSLLTVFFARPFRCERCDARFFSLSFKSRTTALHRTVDRKSSFKSEASFKLGGGLFPPSR